MMRRISIHAIAPIYCILLLILFQNHTHAQVNSSFELYRSNIAAAQANMQLHQFAEARNWLNAAPEKYRAWEWNYLNYTLDQSIGKIELGYIANDMAISPDGKSIAIAGADHNIHIYDVLSKSETSTIATHQGKAYSIAFDPSSQIIYSSGQDAKVIATKITDKSKVWEKSIPAGINKLSVSRDGKLICVSTTLFNGYGYTGNTIVLQAQTGSDIWKSGERKEKPLASAFSNDGSMLAYGEENGVISVIRTDSFTVVQNYIFDDNNSIQQIKDITFSEDGSFLMAANGNGFAQVWNMFTRTTQQKLYSAQQNITTVGYTPNGFGMVTGASDGSIALWSTESATVKQELFGHIGEVKKLLTTQNGDVLVSLSADGTLRFWDLAKAGTYINPMGFSGLTYAFEVSADSKYLFTQGEFGLITQWNNATGYIEKQFPSLPEIMNDITIDHDNHLIAACDNEGHVRAWETATGKRYDDYFGVEGAVYDLDYNPDGTLLAAASADSNITIWNAVSGGIFQQIHFAGQVMDLSFSYNGKMIAGVSSLGIIGVWNMETKEFVFNTTISKNHLQKVLFSPNGQNIIATDDNGTIYILAADSGKLLKQLNAHTGIVYDVSFSVDGKRLASGGGDGTIKIWDTETWESVLSFNDMHVWIHNVQFSSDGNHLYINAPTKDFKRYSIK